MKTNYKHVLKLSAVTCLALISEVSMATPIDILKGSDYFHTVAAGLPGLGSLIGRPGGVDDIRPQYAPLPAAVDTIVERQADCNVSLGGSCSIAIELVGLSLQSTDGSFWVREDINRASSGSMTINYLTLDVNGVASGTFDSFFDVFFQYSVDGGTNWFAMETPIGLYPGVQPYKLGSNGSAWSSDPNGTLLLTGSVGDQDANGHTGKSPNQYDFFSGEIHEAKPLDPNGPFHDVVPVPTPPTVFLIGAGLLGLLRMRKHNLAA